MNALHDKEQQAPIAIGGVGGSGTRIVAKIVRLLGIYIGDSLNPQLDNLWFTIFFKQPRWYRAFPTNEEICRVIRLFERAMVHGLAANVSAEDVSYIHELTKQGEDFVRLTGATREDGEQLVGSRGMDLSRHIAWGWKEPNTHVFLEQLSQEIEGLKYIHVIRHGLDMAFSENRQQVMNWGRRYGLKDERIRHPDAAGILDYWIAANVKAIQVGETLLKERFLLLNHDELCSSPCNVITRLLEFLTFDPAPSKMEQLTALVRRPSSAGRFAAQNMGQFSSTQLAAVERLGFDTSKYSISSPGR